MRKLNGTMAVIFCAAFVCFALFAFVGVPAFLRNIAHSHQVQAEAGFLASEEQTPEWKARAKAFDLHKKTAAAVFAGATRVQVFRVAQSDREAPKGVLSEIKAFGHDGPGPLSYYAQGPDQNRAFAARLGAIIFDPRTYPFPGQSIKLCDMEPAVDFRVWKDAEFVDVLICFRCNQMAVLEYTPDVPMTDIDGMMDARSYVGGDIDAARPRLLALAKASMPSDLFMQSLD